MDEYEIDKDIYNLLEIGNVEMKIIEDSDQEIHETTENLIFDFYDFIKFKRFKFIQNPKLVFKLRNL